MNGSNGAEAQRLSGSFILAGHEEVSLNRKFQTNSKVVKFMCVINPNGDEGRTSRIEGTHK